MMDKRYIPASKRMLMGKWSIPPGYPYEDPKIFITRNIKELSRANPTSNGFKSRGVHNVLSGLNDKIRETYHVDPNEMYEYLYHNGIIDMVLAKGGMMIYLAGESVMPKVYDNRYGVDVVPLRAKKSSRAKPKRKTCPCKRK